MIPQKIHTLFYFAIILLPFSMGQFDLIIRNVKIIDGSGSPWFKGDVGVASGLITAVGSLPRNSTATETLNGGGTFYLAPGFIDSHTHDDAAILQNSSHSFKVVQGVTTIITGNCGFSNYPEGHLPVVQEHLRSLLGDVPNSSFFSNFSSLKATLTSRGIGLNVGSLVGHGPIRLSVMGYEAREASLQEISKMADILDAQLSQGALGLSLGLVYPPSSYAGRGELTALASVVARHGKLLASHIRSYEGGLISSVQEFLEVLRTSSSRGLLSHLQAAGIPYWNTSIPTVLSILEKVRDEEGLDVAIDMYPYTAGSSTILQLLPPSAMSSGIDGLLEALESPEYLHWLKNMTEGGREDPGWESKIALIGYQNVNVGSVVNANLSQFEGISLTQAAAVSKQTEFDFLVHLLKEDRGMTNIIMFQQSQDDNYKVFASRLQVVGSDSIPRAESVGGTSKPHPRGYGSFPRVLGRYAGVVGGLEEAVRKCTWATASRFGIRDRGLIIPGLRADLVLFSEDIMDRASYDEPMLGPVGLAGVWVNGVRVVGPNGEPIATNIRPGMVLT